MLIKCFLTCYLHIDEFRYQLSLTNTLLFSLLFWRLGFPFFVFLRPFFCPYMTMDTFREQLSWLGCSSVILPAILTLSIYAYIGISSMMVILSGGAGKNGSTVAVCLHSLIFPLPHLLSEMQSVACSKKIPLPFSSCPPVTEQIK